MTKTIKLYDGLEDERRQPHTVDPDLTYTDDDLRKTGRTMYPKGKHTESAMQRKTDKFNRLMEVIN